MPIRQQAELERSITKEAVEQFKRDLTRAKQNNALGNTSTGNTIIINSIKDFTLEIEKYCIASKKGRPVRSTEAAKAIQEVTPEKAAVIASNIILNSLFECKTRQSLFREIGQGLENELRMMEFKKENPSYYKQSTDNLNSRNAKAKRKLTVLTYVFAHQLNFEVERWSIEKKILAGMVLVELFMETTGLIEYEVYFQAKKRYKSVVPTVDLLRLMEDLNIKLALLNPQLLPMICKPKAWKSLWGGGYITEYFKRIKLVKNSSKSYLQKLLNHQMPKVYSAVNHLQNTRWQINTLVLDVFRNLWNEGYAIAELPNREDEVIPPYPFPEKQKGDTLSEEQQKIERIWKREAYEIHKRNIQKRSVRILVAQILRIAEKFKDYEDIYFPCQLDFRGRIYPIPVLLNFQGNDIAKGLLRFSEGKKVNGDKNAIKWLMIHGANVYGYDKASFEDRINWVKDKETEICSYAQNPLINRGWAEADKPFQFLAWCFEYNEFLQNPEGFETHLPIQLDGTCNGLQNYAALLKDKVGGKAVNLIDSDIPADTYNEVAAKLTTRIEPLTETDKFAKKWLDLGFDRKLTKRPVMVLPYGGSLYSCREYIEEYMKEHYSTEFLWQHFNIGKTPNDCIFKASKWLSHHLWEAIKDTLGAAIKGMDFLKKVASSVSAKNQYLEWVTPSGFLVRQKYPVQSKKMIRTELYGNVLKATFNLDTEKLDKKRQTNGICANFIHSLDASCLMVYLNKCKAEGINSVMCVHDCYATHATDTETSARLLREAFTEIYSQPILENFISDIKKSLPDEELDLPELPQFGDLEIEDVKSSRYFFN